MIDLDKEYKMHDEIVSRNNPNGTVVLMRMDDSEVFYKINGVAAECWKLLLEGKTPRAIIGEITRDYDCQEEQVQKDLTQFLGDLLGKAIIS